MLATAEFATTPSRKQRSSAVISTPSSLHLRKTRAPIYTFATPLRCNEVIHSSSVRTSISLSWLNSQPCQAKDLENVRKFESSRSCISWQRGDSSFSAIGVMDNLEFLRSSAFKRLLRNGSSVVILAYKVSRYLVHVVGETKFSGWFITKSSMRPTSLSMTDERMSLSGSV